jgi:hypothetical protein
VVVYFIGPQPAEHADEALTAGPVVSSGNIERADSAEPRQDESVPSPDSKIPEAVISDSGQELSTSESVKPSLDAPADNKVHVEDAVAAVSQSMDSGSPPRNSPDIAPVENARRLKSAAKGSSAGATDQAKGAAAKPSPSRRLEDMRQTLTTQNVKDPMVSSVRPKNASVSVVQPASQERGAGSTAQAKPLEKDTFKAQVTPVPAFAPAPPPAPVSSNPNAEQIASTALPLTGGAGIDEATIRGLDNLTSAFRLAYEAGDLSLLLSLFAEDASTNDRSDKMGIAADYRELFGMTEKRTFVIDGLRWEKDKDGIVTGNGNFHADLKFKDNPAVTSVAGKITFQVRRNPQGTFITRMLHTYN